MPMGDNSEPTSLSPLSPKNKPEASPLAELFQLYQALAQDKEWTDLIKKTEKLLGDSERHYISRIFWVYAQHKSRAIPATILMPGFCEASQGLLRGTPAASREELLAIISEIAIGLEETLSSSGATELAEMLRLSLPDVQFAADEKEEASAILPLGSLSDSKEKLKEHTDTHIPPSKKTISTSSGFWRKALLVVFILFTGGALSYGVYHFVFSPTDMKNLSPYPIFDTERVNTPLLLPELEEIEQVKSDALSGLLKALEKRELEEELPAQESGNLSKESQEVASQDGAESGETPPPKMEATIEEKVSSAPSEPKPAPELKTSPEQVNTSGPIEPEWLKEQRLEGPESARPKKGESTVKLGPDSLQRSDAPSDLGFYTVTRPTHVYRAPSFQAETLTELFYGDKVWVTRRLDRWFEVRSKSGNLGFVLGEDIRRM